MLKRISRSIRCTKEQAIKLRKGMRAINDIKTRLKELEKELAINDDHNYDLEKISMLNNKIAMLKGILNAAKKSDIGMMRIIGADYDKLYPDDFDD